MPRIGLWIVIVFFIVSSTCSPSVFVEKEKATCFRTVSRKVPRNTHDEIDRFSKQETNKFLEAEKAGTFFPTEYDMVWQDEKICCPGYQDNDGTCTPQCSMTCGNGHCAQPDICNCDNNWDGDSCNDPLFCIVTQTIRVNVSGTVNQIPDQEDIEDETEHLLLKWEQLPECLPECLDQVVPVNRTQYGNMTYHLFPFVKPCNTVAAHWIFLKKYSYAIVGVTVMIILFAIVICIVHIVRRKRIPSIIPSPALLDTEYEYVDLRQANDGMACYSKT